MGKVAAGKHGQHLTAPADQAKLFFTVPPPPAVTAGEAVLTLLGMG